MFKKYLLLIIIAFSHTVRAHETQNNDPAQDMVSAANNFISSLSKEQQSEALFKPNDDHREQSSALVRQLPVFTHAYCVNA